MKSCEATGKNIEQAIENALLELHASREDVDIKILSEGGFLKKAKVLVSISEDALDKYERKEELKKNLANQNAKGAGEGADEEADEDFAGNFLKKKISSVGDENLDSSKAEKTENNKKSQKNAQNFEEKAQKTQKNEENDKTNQKHSVKIFADDEISDRAKKDKTTKRAATHNVDGTGLAEGTESAEGMEAAEGAEGAEGREKSQYAKNRISGEEFLHGVLKSLQLEGEIEKTEDEKFVRYSLSGEDLSDLIGYHGECMLALSYLMNSACATPEHKRIVLDVSDYRAKRAESLTALAKRIADKVAKSGRYYKLEPMDASERKIIHTALQDDERVTTLSKGEEPHRYLMVFPKEYSDRD